MATEPPEPITTREALLARGLLVVLAVVFLGYALARVPHLDNYGLGDMAVAAQSSAVAARLVHGGHLYRDVVVPDAPGAPLVVAALQRLSGAPRLLHELWIAKLAELLLAFAAYSVSARLAGRLVGVLVAVTSLAVLETPLAQNADTSLAAVLVWTSLALGARALLVEARRDLALFGAAATATLALAFDQAAGFGVLAGWVAGLLYLMSVRRGTPGVVPRVAPRPVIGGVAAGLALLLVLVLAARGTPAGFARDALGDWLSLQGGIARLLAGVTVFSVMQRGAFPSSLVLTGVAFGIGLRVVRRERTLHTRSSPPPVLGTGGAAFVAALAVVAFGVATLLLVTGTRLPSRVVSVTGALADVPAFGFVFAVAYFVAQARPGDLEEGPRRVGYVANALLLVALVESVVERLTFNTLPEGRFGLALLTPLALLFLFLMLSRTGFKWLPGLVAVLTMTSLFGLHLSRALDARTPVTSGFWAGLSVNVHGTEFLRAARRVDELCGPGDTVLVLPEDAELSLLFGHPRPPLLGASVQVQRYPERLVKADLARLAAAPPKVIVLYPRRPFLWTALFALWPGGQGSHQLADGAARLLAKRYHVAGTFRATYVWDQDALVVYARDDAPPGEATP